MQDNQMVTASIAEVDAKGFAVVPQQSPDAPPAWAIDNTAVATIMPAADGMSCVVSAVAPGSANLSVSASFAGQALAGTTAVLVTPGNAAAISIVLGTPVAQAPAAATTQKKAL